MHWVGKGRIEMRNVIDEEREMERVVYGIEERVEQDKMMKYSRNEEKGILPLRTAPPPSKDLLIAICIEYKIQQGPSSTPTPPKPNSESLKNPICQKNQLTEH